MRTIKFRGKRIDNGEWVVGHYVSSTKTTAALIIPEDNDWLQDYEVVDRETVGQFTGLFDNNGKEIYEGDIVKWLFQYLDFEDEIVISEVKYTNGDYMIGFGIFYYPEVIGNIHDNPELLK